MLIGSGEPGSCVRNIGGDPGEVGMSTAVNGEAAGGEQGERGVAFVWARLRAIRAAYLGKMEPIADLEAKHKDLANKAREKGQTWSSLCDRLIDPEITPKELKELKDKMPRERAALKRAEGKAQTAKADVAAAKAEQTRLATLFESVFDQAADGPGLFGDARPAADQVRDVALEDILDEAVVGTLNAAGMRTVGDFIDTVKKKGGVANLGLEGEDVVTGACRSVAAAIKATGDGDKALPPILRPFAPDNPPQEPAGDAGSEG